MAHEFDHGTRARTDAEIEARDRLAGQVFAAIVGGANLRERPVNNDDLVDFARWSMTAADVWLYHREPSSGRRREPDDYERKVEAIHDELFGRAPLLRLSREQRDEMTARGRALGLDGPMKGGRNDPPPTPRPEPPSGQSSQAARERIAELQAQQDRADRDRIRDRARGLDGSGSIEFGEGSPVRTIQVSFAVPSFNCGVPTEMPVTLRMDGQAHDWVAIPVKELREIRARDLVRIVERMQRWSAETFGPGERSEGIANHIRKELREVESERHPAGRFEEWIDIAILALDAAWRCGASPSAVWGQLVEKLAVNEKRRWPDWRTVKPGQPIEHIREEGGS